MSFADPFATRDAGFAFNPSTAIASPQFVVRNPQGFLGSRPLLVLASLWLEKKHVVDGKVVEVPLRRTMLQAQAVLLWKQIVHYLSEYLRGKIVEAGHIVWWQYARRL